MDVYTDCGKKKISKQLSAWGVSVNIGPRHLKWQSSPGLVLTAPPPRWKSWPQFDARSARRTKDKSVLHTVFLFQKWNFFKEATIPLLKPLQLPWGSLIGGIPWSQDSATYWGCPNSCQPMLDPNEWLFSVPFLGFKLCFFLLLSTMGF